VTGPVSLLDAAVGRHLDALCEIGNRFVGTRGEAQAREYVLACLRQCGLERVHTEPVTVRGYAAGDAACELPAWSLTLAADGFQGTAVGEVQAEAVFLGGGQSAAEILAHESRLPSLRGRIAVFQSYWPWEVTAQLAERGVAGVVLISELPDDRIAALPAGWYGDLRGGEVLPYPGVVVGAGSARGLLSALAAGETSVRLRHDASYPRVETANLLGEVPGDERGEHVVVAAHYDTFRVGDGAHDNASGLAGLLAFADALAAGTVARTRRTLQFASFAAEELGLCGAREYCRANAASLSSCAAMVNLDAIAWQVSGRRCLVVSADLEEYATERLRADGWAPELIMDGRTAGSDMAPFVAAGVPSAWCWLHPPQHVYFASEGDTRELVDVKLVSRTAEAACGLAVALANEPRR
jgi:hypothetical protein